MRAVLVALSHSILSLFRSRLTLSLEIIALRHQLAVLNRQAKRSRITNPDRMLWIALRRLWPKWQQALVIVKPATVVRWHRAGLSAYWRWKSRPRGGRPRIEPEARKLIRQMWLANPTWGRPRIQAELAKIGIRVSDSTVRKYKPKRRGPPSQTWRTFLDNHLDCTVGMDFLDRSAGGASVSVRCCAEVSDPRPRRHLWGAPSQADCEPRNRGGAHGLPLALAESLLRTSDRHAPPRVSRPRDRLERSPLATDAMELPALLPRGPNPPGSPRRLPAIALHRASVLGSSR